MIRTDQSRQPIRWAVTLPAMVLPLAASFFYFVVFPGTTFGHAFYTGIKIFLLLWPFIAVLGILREHLSSRVRDRRHKLAIILGSIFGLVTVGIMVGLIELTPLSEVVYGNTERIAGRIADLGVANHYLLFAVFISVIHAALEEFFWRWFVYGQLRQLLYYPAAHFLAAAAFASHHIVILSQFFPMGWAIFLGVCVGIGGAFWTWLFEKTNSLIGPWVSHMIVDLGIMWVGWEVLHRSVG